MIRIAAAPHGAPPAARWLTATAAPWGSSPPGPSAAPPSCCPSDLAITAARDVAAVGGAHQGFIGISSTSVNLPVRQRAGRAQEYGLLVTGLVQGSPADGAGLMVGDVIVGFEGDVVQEPEQLVMRLRGDRVGKPATVTIVRGDAARDVTITIGERRR